MESSGKHSGTRSKGAMAKAVGGARRKAVRVAVENALKKHSDNQ